MITTALYYARAENKRARALILLSITGVTIVLLGLLSLLAALREGQTAAVGIGGMVFLSSASVGGVLGFLFAVPRVLAQGGSDSTSDVSRSAPADKLAKLGGETGVKGIQESRSSLKARLLGSNTNLERISDWLTTMLVGVGLSQLNNIDFALTSFGTFLANEARVVPGVAGAPPTAGILPALGPMLLVFGLVVGFLFLYLYTRLVLTTLFHDIEKVLDSGINLGQQPIVDPKAREAVVSAAQDLRQTTENPALNLISVGQTPSIDESLAVMFNYLYRPEGYQQVIDLAVKLSSTPATLKPEYWFYQAAAFGQKYSRLSKTNTAEAELLTIRDNALDCARRAVAIDPSYRSRLWSISNPDAVDNDLAAFRDDPTFRSIVGVT